MMTTCDTCHKLLMANSLIVWNEDKADRVTGVRFVHRGQCDNERRFKYSGSLRDLARISTKRFVSVIDTARVHNAVSAWGAVAS